MPSGNSSTLIFYCKHRNKTSGGACERKILVFWNLGLEHWELCGFCQEPAEGLGLLHQRNTSLYTALNVWTQDWNPAASWGWWSWFGSFMKGLYQSCVDLFEWENHPKGSNSQGRGRFLGLCCPSIPTAPPHFGILPNFVSSQPNPVELGVHEDSCSAKGGNSCSADPGRNFSVTGAVPGPRAVSHMEGGVGNAQGADHGKLTLCSATAAQNVCYPSQRMLQAGGMKSEPGSLGCSRHWGTAIDSSS